jgi:DNA-binding NarL/FixJ family response regulator
LAPVSSPPRAEAGYVTHTILIVDDSAIIRRSLRFWIEQTSDWKICGEAENGKVAVEKVEELHPDIVILDFQMPVMNGLEAARRITILAPNTAIVMFTMHSSEQLAKDARAAGIQNVVSKSDDLAAHLLTSLKSLSLRS